MSGLATERHYSVPEIAEMWNLKPDVIRNLFRHDERVPKIVRPAARHKREYVTLRIPESVLHDVHRKLRVS